MEWIKRENHLADDLNAVTLCYRKEPMGWNLKLANKAQKKKYQTRKAKGVCTMCGKQPPIAERTLCGECVKRSKRYQLLYKLVKSQKYDDWGDDLYDPAYLEYIRRGEERLWE